MAGSILNIQCNQNIECSKNGTVSDFEKIYPGFQTTRKITIANNRLVNCELKTQAIISPNSQIFKFAKFTFSGVDVFPNQETTIGSLSRGQKNDYTLRLYVSTKADNNFANLSEKIDIKFIIGCDNSPEGTVAGTSTQEKKSNCCWWILLVLLLIYFLSLFKNKRRLSKNY